MMERSLTQVEDLIALHCDTKCAQLFGLKWLIPDDGIKMVNRRTGAQLLS